MIIELSLLQLDTLFGTQLFYYIATKIYVRDDYSITKKDYLQ